MASFAFGTEPAYRLRLIIGLFLFDFFAQGTKTGVTSLYAKSYLLTKVKFPSWVVVVASAANALLTLAIFSVVIFVGLVAMSRPPGAAHVGLYLWYVLHYAAVVMGISLAASVLFLRYRDLNEFWDVAVQAGFFIAPIIYPIEIIPERFHWFLYLWPPTPFIQFSRAALVEGTIPTFKAHLLLTVFSVLILAAGALIFRRYSPRAAEYV